MSVSLVKFYFIAGHSTPGCLPESAPACFGNDLDAAREYLADELERAAAELFELEFDNARLDALADGEWPTIEEAHADSASMEGSAGLIRRDPDGDVRATDGWHTIEPDGYAYWIERIAI